MEDTPNIKTLPDELIVQIFKCMSLTTLSTCEHVCKRWRRLARDPDVWNNITIVYSDQGDQKENANRISMMLQTHYCYVRHIKLQYINDYSSVISILKPCININKLELSMCKIDSQFSYDLQMWPTLQVLHFPITLQGSAYSSYNFRYSYHERLTSLSLPDYAVNVENFNSILECKHLKHILFSKVQRLTNENVEKLLVTFKNSLLSFHIYGGKSVDDAIVNLLVKCSLLRNLAIIRCEHLTDQSLFHLSSLTNLYQLQLWNNCNFSAEALLKLFSNPVFFKLTHLRLSRIKNITPNVVDVIADNYQSLIFLSFYQCPLVYAVNLKLKFPSLDVIY